MFENTSDTASGERRLSRRTVPQRGDKQYGRSAVTNHQDLLPGADQCSDIKLGLLRRLAAVTVQSELTH
jgi:hypothetical protein